MAARTKARKRALDVLFEADQRGVNVSQVLDERLADSGAQTPLPEYSVEIVRGVLEHWRELEATVEAASQDWTLTRMPAVDRALLRIGAWEVLHQDEIPVAVAIDQAVHLAGELSTEDSPRFVNGVLGAIARGGSRDDAGTGPGDTDDAGEGVDAGDGPDTVE